MNFDERTEGDYRIFAGALDAPHGGGYIAAVVVSRTSTAREAYRDTSMAGGYRWPSPDDALAYAVARAREVIRTESKRMQS